MSEQLILRSLLGSHIDEAEWLVSPPASGWRTGPAALRRRELVRLRSRSMPDRERVNWAAPPGRRPRYPALRQSLLGGNIWVVLPPAAPIGVMRSTTGFVPTDEVRIGSGGGIRQLGSWRGRPVLARLGVEGTPGDPARHFQALQHLRLAEVPDGLGSGDIDGVRWTIEAFHEGRSLDRLAPTETSQVPAFLARLPRANGPISVVDLATRELLAVSVDVGELAGSIRKGLEGLPAVVAHGDLWAGNLLFKDGQLVGVIDWDSWQEQAVPGTDLLHMWAENARRRRGISYGDLVEEAFWSNGQLQELVRAHLEQLGTPWNPALQPLLGAAWWLAAVCGALRRTPALVENPIWMKRNVRSPATTLTQLVR